jgi:oligoribonuclease NrnB/cAMP/cGMP phosphodiesterase (DHH superfamily)
VSKHLCIYHGSCADGFTAAWVVRLAHGEENVEFYSGFYKDPPPDVTDRVVYIVDFSYKRAVMEELVRKARKVIHIDHHDTAIRDMAGFEDPKFESLYSHENTESGAMLTWRYFYPHSDSPMFIKHIDDRDRWQFKILGTREIQANIFSYDYTFENWDMLVKLRIEDQIREGTAIERRMAKDIRELMKVVVRRMNIAGYNIPAANVPYQFGSDTCEILGRNEPFAAYYYDTPDGRQFGLRSSLDGVDVGKIAAQFGGGGHEHASGFIVSFEKAQEFEV